MQKLKLKYKIVIVSCIEILTNTVSLQNIKHLIILLSIPRKSTTSDRKHNKRYRH